MSVTKSPDQGCDEVRGWIHRSTHPPQCISITDVALTRVSYFLELVGLRTHPQGEITRVELRAHVHLIKWLSDGEGRLELIWIT